MTIEEKKKIKNAVALFIKNQYAEKSVGKKAHTKLKNMCNKTGQYGIPSELFQKRTLRRNRVLISWKEVRDNNITIEQLQTFSGGVVVEFVNEDYFINESSLESVNQRTYLYLRSQIGSDELVSAIITFRSEAGTSSSRKARQCFDEFIKGTEVICNEKRIVIDESNYSNYLLEVVDEKAGIKTGNDAWKGFLFYSIKGGDHKPKESHAKKELRLFNPACEYATDKVSVDIDLVMLYFALSCIDKKSITDKKKLKKYDKISNQLKQALEESIYNSTYYSGNLLDYCNNHISILLNPGCLTDPIQAKKIEIVDFAIDDKSDFRNLDFTHNEAVKKKKYYWDEEQKCILSAARPTNVFWSKHSSNMMQQDMSLEEYFAFEKDNIKRRKKLLKKSIGP